MKRAANRFKSPLRFSKMSLSILKLLVAILFIVACLYVAKYAVSKTPWMRRRAVSDGVHSKWQCELNLRLLQQLRKEIREKDSLLKYRGKIIFNLRNEVTRLNKTITSLNETSCNLPDVFSLATNLEKALGRKTSPSLTPPPDKLLGDLFRKNKLMFQSTTHQSPKTMLPLGLAQKSEECVRPCCIALKRMNDIIREHAQTESGLRDRTDAFEKVNATEEMLHFADIEKWKYAALNCSGRFQSHLTRKKDDKYALYQAFLPSTFYETPTVYRADPSQAYATKFHRNLDFKAALKAALQNVALVSKIPEKQFAISDGLVKLDELHGMTYDFNFLVNRSRSFSVAVIKPFGPYILSGAITETTAKQSELINIIVPVSGYSERFHEFLRNIEGALAAQENIFLTVVVYGPDPRNEVRVALQSFSKRHDFKKYDILKRSRMFSRAHALHDGAMRWDGNVDVLLFFCDIDVRFDVQFLRRCRRHAKLNQSIYMPVLFSLYNPERVYGPGVSYNNMTFINITKDTGDWRAFGYGMVCTYRSDYLKVGGLNLRIRGWGGEDVDLYKRFYKSNTTIIRAPDPGIFHIWHPKFCDPKLKKSQYEGCLGSRARFEASQRQLGMLLLKRDAN